MDFEKVKTMVVENSEYGGYSKKEGDKYRSFLKQIDNIIYKLKDEESPFSWLPKEIMSEEIFACLIEQYLQHNKASRLAIHNITKQTRLYSYYELFHFKDEEAEKQTDFILKEEPAFQADKENNKNWLLEELYHFRILIRDFKGTSYKTHFLHAAYGIKYNINEMLKSIKIYKTMGMKKTDYNEIGHMIHFLDVAFRDFILFFIIECDEVENKKEILERFENKILEKEAKIGELADAERELASLRRETKQKNDIITYFTQYLDTQNHFSIQKKISDSLIRDSGTDYGQDLNFIFDSKNEEKWISNYNNISERHDKFKKFKKLLHLAKTQGNPITYDIFYQKAAFCEIFIDKRSYSRRKALRQHRTIAKRAKM